MESRGGLVAVQDPEESPFDGMPRAAIAATARPMVAGLADIAEWIVRQSDGAREVQGEAVDRELERELSPFYSAGALPRPPGDLSALTCPRHSGTGRRGRRGGCGGGSSRTGTLDRAARSRPR